MYIYMYMPPKACECILLVFKIQINPNLIMKNSQWSCWSCAITGCLCCLGKKEKAWHSFRHVHNDNAFNYEMKRRSVLHSLHLYTAPSIREKNLLYNLQQIKMICYKGLSSKLLNWKTVWSLTGLRNDLNVLCEPCDVMDLYLLHVDRV